MVLKTIKRVCIAEGYNKAGSYDIIRKYVNENKVLK